MVAEKIEDRCCIKRCCDSLINTLPSPFPRPFFQDPSSKTLLKMPSKLSSIPLERVSSDAIARAACFDELKCIENKPIVSHLLDIASIRQNENANIYSVAAYRRAAIIIATTNFVILHPDTTDKNLVAIGLPSSGVIIDTVSMYIRHLIVPIAVSLNNLYAFPPEWRDDINDVRVKKAIDMLDYFDTIKNMPCLEMNPYMRDGLLDTLSDNERYQAYSYYSHRPLSAITTFRDTILSHFNSK
jgi:hypothetical protein